MNTSCFASSIQNGRVEKQHKTNSRLESDIRISLKPSKCLCEVSQKWQMFNLFINDRNLNLNLICFRRRETKNKYYNNDSVKSFQQHCMVTCLGVCLILLQLCLREEGDIWLFITPVPEVLLQGFLIRWLDNFGDFCDIIIVSGLQ